MPARYSLITRHLHHLGVLWVLILIISAKFDAFIWHKTLGVLFGIYLIIRLVYLVRCARPQLALPALITGVRHLTHALLYLSLGLLCISGVWMTAARDSAIAGLMMPAMADAHIAHLMHRLHMGGLAGLGCGFGLHIVIIGYHLARKNGVFGKMVP